MSKRFDTRAWRLAERLAAAPKKAYRRLQEQSPRAVKRWDPAARTAEIPSTAAHLCEGLVTGMTISEKLEAFRHSVDSGAHGVAAPLARDIYDAIPALAADKRKRAVAALVNHHHATGDLDGLERIEDVHSGASPRLDPAAIASNIDSGTLAPNDVAQILRTNWRDVLANPQLHLLAHRSKVDVDIAAATAALNRYLRAEGSVQITAVGDSGHYLRDLRFAPVPKVTGGPMVSIVVSAYNAAETIGYAMRSLLDQSYQNLEILVCDDASTDETQEILRRDFGDDPRVRLFRSLANQGTYNIRNTLIARSTGELITTHDADDLCLPRRIELQVQQLRVPTKSASITNLLRVQPSGRIEFFRDSNANRMSIVSLMAPRRVVEGIGPYRRARFGADFEFLEKLKARHGASSIARVRRPQMLCLWAEQSATKQEDSQALSTGYRSPARRLYSDLVYRQRVLGPRTITDEYIDEKLRESGNWRDPTGVIPL